MTKGKILQSIWDNLPDDRKQRIQARAEQLETEYLTLQELRKAAGLTQAEISRSLRMPQSNVSRLERESDMLLSTLRNYIDAIGGNLTIVVELPNKPPVRLNTLSDLVSQDVDSKDHLYRLKVGRDFLEGNDPVAVQVREMLATRNISDIVAQLEHVYQNTPRTKWRYAGADVLAGTVANSVADRELSDGNEKIQIQKLAKNLLDKLAELWEN
ncbi:hypothetical protein NUACC21_30820 [Scytonema sp. NUACC21]